MFGAGPLELEMDAAVGFHYHVQQGGLQRVVVTAKENTITFYSAVSTICLESTKKVLF